VHASPAYPILSVEAERHASRAALACRPKFHEKASLPRTRVIRRDYLAIAVPKIRLFIRLLDYLEGGPAHDPDRLLP
jgi:hypothetical protein